MCNACVFISGVIVNLCYSLSISLHIAAVFKLTNYTITFTFNTRSCCKYATSFSLLGLKLASFANALWFFVLTSGQTILLLAHTAIFTPVYKAPELPTTLSPFWLANFWDYESVFRSCDPCRGDEFVHWLRLPPITSRLSLVWTTQPTSFWLANFGDLKIHRKPFHIALPWVPGLTQGAQWEQGIMILSTGKEIKIFNCEQVFCTS